MTLQNELNYYEILSSEPPEKRPTATNWFKDFKTLATITASLQATRALRRIRYIGNSSIRHTT